MTNNHSLQVSKPNSLKGNYNIESEIGGGANGRIYKATQNSTGQAVAIKTIKFKEGIEEHKRIIQIARFDREARICAGFNHPNIVKILDKGITENNEPFAVFEYVAGTTLKDYILQNKGLSIKEAAELMGQILDALVCAHKKGVVHRDLKPHNIMVSDLDTKKHAKILDFGIGAFTQDYEYLNTNGHIRDFQGTPAYCAPEQLRGEPYTVKSDFYAWGLIFIECLTGKPVMAGNAIAEIFEMQLSATDISIPPLIEKHPLGKLLRKVLEKKHENRPENALMIYQEFRTITLSDIKGKFEPQAFTIHKEADFTIENQLRLSSVTSSRKQITVLCLKLALSATNSQGADMEILDTIQKDQLNICKETALKYGGFIAGSLMNQLIVYFGYPGSDDTDARRAGRTALELISSGKKRSALLEEQYNLKLNISISMHTGVVLCQANSIPEGIVPNSAMSLLNYVSPGNVLFSASSKKLLEPYLEFEAVDKHLLPNEEEWGQAYRLVGEQRTEALSSSRKWSRNRQCIGRDKEKDSILQIWNNVFINNGATVLVTGQAGIGKSRLVYEIKKEILLNETVVRECRCLPEHQNNALYPFMSMFRNHWGIVGCESNDTIIEYLKEALNHAKSNTDEVLPLLCSWLSVPLPQGQTVTLANPNEQKDILFNAIKNCFWDIGHKGPFVFIMEDMHWIDHTSMEFIELLINDQAQHQCLFIITSRPEFNPCWPVEKVKLLELKPLTEASAEIMIQDIIGEKPVHADAVDYISQRSDCVPFFIEELTAMLLEQNYLVPEGEWYKLIGNIEQKLVPITLQALLNARLEKLGFARETAQLSAAIGREFDYELLVNASIKDEASVQNDLNLMLKANTIYKQLRVNGEVYVFCHALIQDAAYDSMSGNFKKETHLRIAEVLENKIKTSNTPVSAIAFEILAKHLYEGKRISDAITRLLEGAQITVRQSANKETRALCEKALDWMLQISPAPAIQKQELSIRQLLISVIMTIEGCGANSIRNQLDAIQKLCSELNDHEQLFPTRVYAG